MIRSASEAAVALHREQGHPTSLPNGTSLTRAAAGHQLSFATKAWKRRARTGRTRPTPERRRRGRSRHAPSVPDDRR